jgi:hypothetical protein
MFFQSDRAALFSGVFHWFLSVEKIFQPPADELELKERCLEDF